MSSQVALERFSARGIFARGNSPTSVLALAMLQRPETGGTALIFRNIMALVEQEGGMEDMSVMGVVGVETWQVRLWKRCAPFYR